MTLKELLLGCDFDNVATCIREIYDSQSTMILHYKEVFDKLRHTEAIPSEGNIRIGMAESDWEDEPPYISVDGCHGATVEETLGKELQVEVEISPEETAARFLWEFTFLGFSDEDIEERLGIGREKGYTHFGRQAFELGLRHYEGLIYSKNENRRDRLKLIMKHGIAYTMETWDEIRLHKKRCNKIRRKRNYRQKKRIADLERKDKIEHLIRKLTANPASQPFLRNDVEFLFSTSKIWEVKFHTYAYDVNTRVDYLRELIEEYSTYDFQGYDQYLVLATTAPVHPLRPEEALDFIANGFTPGKDILWGYNYDESLGEEIKIRIIMCEFKASINATSISTVTE